MRIRPGTDADLLAIATIHVHGRQAAYRGLVPDHVLDAWTPEAWAEARTADLARHGPALRTWVAEDGDPGAGLLGFADTAPAGDAGLPGAGEVLLLYVDPAAIGGGIGGALLAHATADLAARGFAPLLLWTLEGNVRARRFYERAGWRADGASRPWWATEGQAVALREVRYRRDLDADVVRMARDAFHMDFTRPRVTRL